MKVDILSYMQDYLLHLIIKCGINEEYQTMDELMKLYEDIIILSGHE